MSQPELGRTWKAQRQRSTHHTPGYTVYPGHGTGGTAKTSAHTWVSGYPGMGPDVVSRSGTEKPAKRT
eukprot:540597-Rhodomonas_salina.1